ncbi:hypothetical protein [Geobacter sp. SVR]|uniref:hypothetical protein n=1 Tax=Geobacter sp. SVR TaxID=2495594 RepID=UPI00143F0449|nr:hypothetical protein [Geobacter sp. SVR]BCS54534.1 hypothetical protein GSVR_28420 [Geobacter sp. SVR]GCF87134.1 hypothetical protein GSbR_37340 [Geobacter sp. SVR]
MGAKKPNPRYNVLSCRVNDDTRRCVDHALAGRTVNDFLQEAISEKLIRERQDRLDGIVRITP